jgi:hypothetical protein
MIFWSLRAFIWFKNMKKMLLQMTSSFLQLESTIDVFSFHNQFWFLAAYLVGLMPGFWNSTITNWPVKSSVAIETLESNQSHYMIFVFMGKLTNWPNKIVSRNRA